MTSQEARRQLLQEEYDSSHSQLERNIKGQFATPHPLAMAIARDALSRVDEPLSVLEPSCGTGVFISCLRDCNPSLRITGVEKDDTVFNIADSLWADNRTNLLNDDFFNLAPGLGDFDLLVTNPPYSRHHHLSADEKNRYGSVVEIMTGIHLSQLAGLHAYFILVGTGLLKTNGIASWLIPSELFSVNYGRAVRDYVTSNVTVERVHFFNNSDLQFDDALVSSCVLVVRNKQATPEDLAEITLGDFEHPSKISTVSIEALRHMDKWQHFFEIRNVTCSSTVADYFSVKRGLSTGAESFYSKQRDEWANLGIADDWLTPVLPAPRNMHSDVVFAGENGWPRDYSRALLNIPLSVPTEALPSAVVNYLDSCPDKIRNSYTSTHRKRWFSIEQREPAPIVCTYMSRSDSQPFRFIRNKSNAVVTTAYLCLYPRESLNEDQLDEACGLLNSIDPALLISSGREYGGGLRKLEPKELLSVPFAL